MTPEPKIRLFYAARQLQIQVVKLSLTSSDRLAASLNRLRFRVC